MTTTTEERDRMTAAPTYLAYGAHRAPEDGACLLEAVSMVAGEPFTDHPVCVSPVLAAFGRGLNDAMPDAERQELLPLVPLLVGTVDQAQDQVDGLRCAHFFVSEWTAEWLALMPELAPHAVALRALPAPASWDDVEAWAPVLAAAGAAARDAARDAAGAAAGAAAWAAAGDAAGAAAGAAARAAAGAAARDAARDAAGAAAWDAAGAAAGDAAWAAARAAAGAAAGAAARDAARDAAGAAAWAAARAAARDAARDAAGDALRPVSDALRARTTALFTELVEGRRA